MVIITLKNKISFYIDSRLKKNLDILLDACTQNDDFFIVVDGPEGAGKSVLMQQIGAYCADYLDTKFNIDNIQFKLNEYVDFSLEQPFYTVNILDEGRMILNRKASMSRDTKKFTNFASECRKKRHIHIIGLPAFHDLDSYIVMWRMKMLIHVHKGFKESKTSKSGYALDRGGYTVYTNMTQIAIKYEYKYQYPKQFETKGNFKPVNIIPTKEYDAKKDDNMMQKYHSKFEEEKLGKLEKMWKTRWLKVVQAMKLNRGIKDGEIADACGMEVKTVGSTLSRSSSLD